MKFITILLTMLSTGILSAQSIDEWYINYYLPSDDMEQDIFRDHTENFSFNPGLFNEILDSTIKISIYIDRKFIIIERRKLDEVGQEEYDGEQLYFDKNGYLYYSAIYQNGELIKEFGYLYYNRKATIPMIKYELKGDSIWNVEDYYLPNGALYNSYGNFQDGNGILNHIYYWKKENPDDFPVAYEYYFKNGKQKSRIVKRE